LEVAMRDTRQQILDVAGELFTEQGYEATSLRQIADRLGFTKAALYYHFQSKEQILAALLEPAEALLQELLRRLEAADGAEAWADALEWVVGEFFEHRDFLALTQRNRTAIEAATASLFESHRQMRERVEHAVRATGDLPQQIRMIAALGAVTAFDDWAPRILAEAPPDELRAELVAATRDILQLPRRRGRRPQTG
jgi:AcrR family transcriptional regulator